MYKLLKELLEGMKQEEKIILLAAIGSRNREIILSCLNGADFIF